jgi:Protein of unknown function (DUF3828)
METALKPAIWVAVLLIVTVPAGSTETKKQGEPQSCKTFVQSFYEWYVPLAHRKDLKGPASNLAMKYKKSAFSARLYQALKTDSDAQARSQELVGLDFDPFLNSQDPDPRYEVRSVKESDEHCSAEVLGVGDGEKRTQADVVAELAHGGEGWKFVNFHYPRDKTDLLEVLKGLEEDRRKSAQ